MNLVTSGNGSNGDNHEPVENTEVHIDAEVVSPAKTAWVEEVRYRKLVRWTIGTTIGLLFVLLVLGAAYLQREGDVRELERLGTKLDQLTYEECLQRNERSEASTKILADLATAHTTDGNTNAAAVWQRYLDASLANPLPVCQDPASG